MAGCALPGELASPPGGCLAAVRGFPNLLLAARKWGHILDQGGAPTRAPCISLIDMTGTHSSTTRCHHLRWLLQPSTEAELLRSVDLLRNEIQQYADIVIVPGGQAVARRV